MAASQPPAPALPFRVAIATTADPMVVLPKLTTLCGAIKGVMDQSASGHLMVSYEELELGANADGFELMWLPPLIALSLVPSGAAHPVAVPVRNGETTYATALFTRSDAGIESLDDLDGKTAAWVDKHSSAGYVLPRALLRSRGFDPDARLGEQRFLGGHDKVVAAVQRGQVDLGATFVTLNEDGSIQRAAWGDADVKVLATYGPIPSDLLACGRRLGDDARQQLTERMLDPESPLSTAARDLMDCDRFAEVDERHLEALAALAKS
jgi:phosphate/phosphite/phosphonate ABC transporter binding protein